MNKIVSADIDQVIVADPGEILRQQTLHQLNVRRADADHRIE